MAEDQNLNAIVRSLLGLTGAQQPMETNALIRELARRMVLSGFYFDETTGAVTNFNADLLDGTDWLTLASALLWTADNTHDIGATGATRPRDLHLGRNATIGGTLDISGASAGQVVFPASQNASSNVNTLDDYEESTWTPAITFATAGDLSVVYSTQVGSYTKIGNVVRLTFGLTTSTFTHSTASGSLQITGLPFASANVTNNFHIGTLSWQGITKANYTNIVTRVDANASMLTLLASGSAQNLAAIAAADMPTGGTVSLRGTLVYQVET